MPGSRKKPELYIAGSKAHRRDGDLLEYRPLERYSAQPLEASESRAQL